jgi:hypothetical protein
MIGIYPHADAWRFRLDATFGVGGTAMRKHAGRRYSQWENQ